MTVRAGAIVVVIALWRLQVKRQSLMAIATKLVKGITPTEPWRPLSILAGLVACIVEKVS
jgi:hypothetical protein